MGTGRNRNVKQAGSEFRLNNPGLHYPLQIPLDDRIIMNVSKMFATIEQHDPYQAVPLRVETAALAALELEQHAGYLEVERLRRDSRRYVIEHLRRNVSTRGRQDRLTEHLAYVYEQGAGIVFPRRWFSDHQPRLFDDDQEPLSFSITDVARALTLDDVPRFAHCRNTYGVRQPEKRLTQFVNGHLVQHGVSQLFHARWPQFWLAPTNDGLVTETARDDFRLSVAGKIYEVDVTSGRPDFIKNEVTPPDIRIYAEPIRSTRAPQSTFVGWSSPKKDAGRAPTIKPLIRLIAWLNTVEAGYDFKSCVIAARRGKSDKYR